MTHIVHPFAHRLGTIRDWRSRWFTLNKFSSFLKSDVLIRDYLRKRLRGMYVAGVDIERNQKTFRLIIKTSRPGLLIGRSGEGMVKLKKDLEAFARREKLSLPSEFKIDIEEVPVPEASAAIVAYMVAEGLEKRLQFRRVLKQSVEKVMSVKGILGVKIALSGRLGGADMARREKIMRGAIPLQTIRADVDFAKEEAYLTYGVIGVKVWIYKGEIFEMESKAAAKNN